jgi:hypothetical protein
VYSESSFSEIGVCWAFSSTGESPFEPGGWTAPDVIPSVSSGGRRWGIGIVGVGGTTTSVKSSTGATEIGTWVSCSCRSTTGFEVSACWVSSTCGSCGSDTFGGAFSCGGGGWKSSSIGFVTGEGYIQGAIKRKNLDRNDERPGCGRPWLLGLEFLVGDGITLRVSDGTVW